MIQVLKPGEDLAQLDTMGRPLRQIVGQELDGMDRALHPAQLDRVGNVGAQCPRFASEYRDAEQVADVSESPMDCRSR